jgi:methionyl-tRNA formyltransferase
MNQPGHWKCPRTVSVVIDNASWMLPYGEALVAAIQKNGDHATLCRSHDAIAEGTVAFFLGCVKITPPAVLARNSYNIVVHASDLPRGKGFSPLKWLLMGGTNTIPVCLFEAVEELDAGDVYYRTNLVLEGHELMNEIHPRLGQLTQDLCLRFLDEPTPPKGIPQSGTETRYPRRSLDDQRIDPHTPLAMQFNTLRTVENDRFPAFFDLHGQRYRLRIEKWGSDS